MTNQEAFDRVVQWFIVDGNGPSMEGNGCRYRTSDGGRCAVGCLMPDEAYSEALEKLRVDTILWTDEVPGGASNRFDSNEAWLASVSGVRKALEGVDFGLLIQLQEAHDFLCESPYFHRDLIRKLALIADDKGLAMHPALVGASRH